jgi:HAMP domain-containing protein
VKIKNLMVIGTTLLMVGVVLITTMGIILIQGNMTDVNDENTTAAKSSIEEEIGTGAENTAIEILDFIDSKMDTSIMMAQSWTKTPIIIDTAKDGQSYTLEELYDAWSNPSTRQFDGDEAMGDGLPSNDINPETSEYLIALGNTFPGFPEIFFTDSRGYAIAANGATGDFDQGPDDWRVFKYPNGTEYYKKHDPNADGEGWWAAANSASDGLYVGDVEYDFSAGVWGVDICQVIYDPDTNANLGVLKAVYNFGMVLNAVIDVSDVEADEIKIINNQGLIAATSETDQTKVMNSDASVSDLNSYTSASSGIDGYSVEADEDGEEMVIGYASDDNNNWICLVSHKTSTSMVPIRDIESKNSELISDVNSQVMFIVITEVAVAAVILIAVATLLNRKLTKPLVDIADSAKEIKEGNLNVKVDESGNNEITELAKAFNQMVLSVRLISGETEMGGPTFGDSDMSDNLMK